MAAKKIVLLGPPGAGKGTQAKRIVAKTGFLHLSTGDILRDEVARGTELGKKAKGFMDRGELVPDGLIIGMIKGRIEDATAGFLLDGFPRTVPQAEALAGITPLDLVINIQLSREEVVRRLTSRRVCRNCGTIYNLHFQPPADASRCDACGGELYQRDDDQVAVIENRYQIYEDSTAPLVDYYHRKGILHDIDAHSESNAVFAKIVTLLDA